jgi:hypothetical protein
MFSYRKGREGESERGERERRGGRGKGERKRGENDCDRNTNPLQDHYYLIPFLYLLHSTPSLPHSIEPTTTKLTPIFPLPHPLRIWYNNPQRRAIMPRNYYKGNTETHARCTRCKEIFPREEMNKSYCIPCRKEYEKEFRKKPEQRKKKSQYRTKRRRELKAELLQMMGGKCAYCGYDKYQSALDFHHHGDDKTGEIWYLLSVAASGSNTALAKLGAEAAKCTVVCRNCHMAIHSGELEP